MADQFDRVRLMVGNDGLETLASKTVAILGIGGVGSFAAESLARMGVGCLVLVDKDNVDVTNLNRQIMATHETIGKSKVEEMAKRIKAINPACNVICLHMFYTDETAHELFKYPLDFVIDSSDTVTYKIHLIKQCLYKKIKFISAMGAANKLDPSQLMISDITKTSVDPLAKVIRTRLKKDGVKGKVPVVYSKETPIKPHHDLIETPDSVIRKVKVPPASNAFVPSTMGLICASYCFRKLLNL